MAQYLRVLGTLSEEWGGLMALRFTMAHNSSSKGSIALLLLTKAPDTWYKYTYVGNHTYTLNKKAYQ